MVIPPSIWNPYNESFTTRYCKGWWASFSSLICKAWIIAKYSSKAHRLSVASPEAELPIPRKWGLEGIPRWTNTRVKVNGYLKDLDRIWSCNIIWARVDRPLLIFRMVIQPEKKAVLLMGYNGYINAYDDNLQLRGTIGSLVPCAQTKCLSSNQHFGGARLRLFRRLSMIKPHSHITHLSKIVIWSWLDTVLFLASKIILPKCMTRISLAVYLQVLFAAVVGACLLAAPFNELRDRQLCLGMRPVKQVQFFLLRQKPTKTLGVVGKWRNIKNIGSWNGKS